MNSYAVLCLDEMRIALTLQCVERVVRAVNLTTLPDAPDIVLGVINLAGRVIPAVNMRKRFHLPERAVRLTDQFLVAHTGKRAVALVADSVSGVFEYDDVNIINADSILPGLEYVEGVIKLHEDLILIHNLDHFLSLEESAALDHSMAAKAGV